MFDFKNRVTNIMSKSPNRHLGRLQGKRKLKKNKSVHKLLQFWILQCTSQHPISVTDVGLKWISRKILISCLRNLFFFGGWGGLVRQCVAKAGDIQYNNYWQGALVLLYFIICPIKQWVAERWRLGWINNPCHIVYYLAGVGSTVCNVGGCSSRW